MLMRKLAIIIMGIFLVICAGACNIYPLYLKLMMDKFNFTLKEVNLYGTFINLGLWIAYPMGWIYDTLGPKISCAIGGLFLGGSYLALHFIFNSDSTEISIIIFLIIAIIMGQGSALCYTTSVTTNLKNFRFKESSAVVGLLVANMALSPSVFTTYREALKDIQTNVYFLIISIFILVVILICTFIFHNIRRVYNEDEEKKTYEKHKEKKIIKFLIFLNIFILIVYTFGVTFNSIFEEQSENNKFPIIIIYPCLQLINFIVVILEKFGVFDNMYFKPYINKMIIKQIHNEKGNIYKINEKSDPRNIKVNDAHVDIEKIDKEIKEEEINVDNNSVIIEKPQINLEEFTEVKLDNQSLDIIESKDGNSDMKIGNSNDKNESILGNISVNQTEIENKEKLEKQMQQIINNDDHNVSFKEAVSSQNVIFLFIIMLLGIGSEISNLNNIEFIVMAITGENNNTNSNDNSTILVNNSDILNNVTNFSNTTILNTTMNNTNNNYDVKSNVIYSYVVLYFVFNSFTRIMSGLLLDHLIKIKKFFYYLMVITTFGLLSQFLGIFMNRTCLLISISLAGACHGGYSTFIPVFVRNEYGLSNMGKILGILTTGNAIGSLLIADGVFILFHDSFSVNGQCFGSKCFSYSYMITTFFFLINLSLSYVLLKKYLDKINK